MLPIREKNLYIRYRKIVDPLFGLCEDKADEKSSYRDNACFVIGSVTVFCCRCSGDVYLPPSNTKLCKLQTGTPFIKAAGRSTRLPVLYPKSYRFRNVYISPVLGEP